MKKVVVIGGGTGVFTVLTGLKEYPYHLSAVVSMADDGGSTGKLREEFGVLPPGDIRRALIALADTDTKVLSELFNYRFEKKSSLKGHSLGNLLLTALERITGGFDLGVKEAGKILNVKGEVIPVSLTPTKLHALLENGEEIIGETNIDVPKHNGNLKIKKLFLKPDIKAHSDAIKAIKKADVVILGPGDLYTSIIPNLLARGICKALKESNAKKVFIINIMTKFGETNNFKTSDFINEIEKYLGKDIIDTVIVNTEKPKGKILMRYKEQKDNFVEHDQKWFKDKKIKVEKGELLRDGQFLRHDPEKLAKKLASIVR